MPIYLVDAIVGPFINVVGKSLNAYAHYLLKTITKLCMEYEYLKCVFVYLTYK